MQIGAIYTISIFQKYVVTYTEDPMAAACEIKLVGFHREGNPTGFCEDLNPHSKLYAGLRGKTVS